MSAYIELCHVRKEFKETVALHDIQTSFEKGQIHGIIGRNGSGKTVMLKCICGLMKLTSGEILIDGKRVIPGQAQNIGAIIEVPGFIESQSGRKNLEQLAFLRNRIDKGRINEVLQLVGLQDTGKKPVRKYSMGMRQRLGIAQAIMEQPPLLILDEPMNGLDNQGVEDMRRLLLLMKDQGTTILLASHNREDIAKLCDETLELDHGKVITNGSYRLS